MTCVDRQIDRLKELELDLRHANEQLHLTIKFGSVWEERQARNVCTYIKQEIVNERRYRNYKK